MVQTPCLSAGIRSGPVTAVADGIAPLTSRPGAVVEHEAAGTTGRDPGTEARHIVVIGDPVALGGGGKSLDDGVGEMLAHGWCPLCVRLVDGLWCPQYAASCPDLSMKSAMLTGVSCTDTGKTVSDQRADGGAKMKLRIWGSEVRILSGAPR